MTNGRFDRAGLIDQEEAETKHQERAQHPTTSFPVTSHRIVIAATFTADYILRPLSFWMKQLTISAELELAPYGQVLQEMLSARSGLSGNRSGFNVLMIRVEDWVRDRRDRIDAENAEHLRRVVRELVRAYSALQARTGATALIVLCPASPSLPESLRAAVADAEAYLVHALSALPRTGVWQHAQIRSLYPTDQVDDLTAERVGHIPYTVDYFVALGTFVARQIAARVVARPKVIVLDCDNTLWKGICGEDGAQGVELTPAHLEFQRALVKQYEAGALLCLCSKNNPSDVEAAFKSDPHMPLREQHIVASRVNWDAKSVNLRSLAEELDLSLDSFMFLDDSAIECAEVQAHCPHVVTVQVPQTEEELLHFTHHLWAFDRPEVTAEASRRTAMYRENIVRARERRATTDLQKFLASLELEVDVSPMRAEDLTRVAELAQRTNQFNLTTIRRSAAEIDGLCRAATLECLVVRVRDRFGDYGLVGAVMLSRVAPRLLVDTFVLSCRVLGRGVEHRIVRELGRLARESRCERVVLPYRSTERSRPARAFLEETFGAFRVDPGGELTQYQVPADRAEQAHPTGNADPVKPAPAEESGSGEQRAEAQTNAAWYGVTYRLSRVQDIAPAIEPRAHARHAERHGAIGPAAQIAEFFAEVLGLADVDLGADFLSLGGDSLAAVQVITRLEATFGAEISLFDFFEGPTPAQLAEVVRRAQRAKEGAVSSIPHADRAGQLALSWAQQRLWFIDQLEGSRAYRIPIALELRGVLEPETLRVALGALVRRHEVLRTSFPTSEGVPYQRILPDAVFPLEIIDLDVESPRAQDERIEWHLQELMAEPFDLCRGPLVRGRLLRLTCERQVLLISMHHIISDGWSIGVLIRDLGELCCAQRDDTEPALPALTVQYADYAQWHREWVLHPEQASQVRYWEEHLRGAPEALELPSDRPRPATQSFRGGNVPVSLPQELIADARALASRLNLTLAMVLHAAWCVLLARFSGQQDVVVGVPVANRRRTEVEDLIGLFVNTLAVRVRLDDDPAGEDLLQRVRKTLLEAHAHQDVPFEKVVAALQPVRTLSHAPIFQVMFVLQPATRRGVTLPGITIAERAAPFESAQFDLSLLLQESPEGVQGALNYATDLFDAGTIRRWVAAYEHVLTGLVRDSRRRVSELPLMSSEEMNLVADGFNPMRGTPGGARVLHQLFEEQARRTPQVPAVVHESGVLTYAQLDERANGLARQLCERGVGPEQIVGLDVRRTPQLLVGLLGILKAGGAYLPLDPDYPIERLRYMVADAAPRVLLVQGIEARLPELGSRVLALSDSAAPAVTSGPIASERIQERSLAYVIYTSGSTGNPKGVMIEHGQVVDLWHSLEALYASCDPIQRVALNASLNFDASVQQLVHLLSGRTLFLVPQEVRWSAEALLAFLEQHQIQGIDCTPSQLKSWLAAGMLERAGLALKIVLVGGEAIDADLWQRLSKAHIRFVNVYGPTECTVDSTAAVISGDDTPPHIGRPMLNRRVYLLDRHGAPVPIGIPGELWIGGAGVGRGYLNQPQLTAERFAFDPLGLAGSARRYRTGDLGRWRANGLIEFLGRNDAQVKIRGFRIELGEIEARLLDHPLIARAVVIVREDVPGERRLVAYMVPTGPESAMDLTVDRIRDHLKLVLPDYMIPSAFVTLPELPVTPSGKIDRRALPAPDVGAFTSRAYEPPANQVEEILAGVWQELLNLPRVGRRDNFFELGGHSLLIVHMMERLARVGLHAEIRDVFASPTLAEFAAVLSHEDAVDVFIPPNGIPPGCEHITPAMLPLVTLEAADIARIESAVPGGAANIQDIYPLAPLQEGFLFHHLLDGQTGDTYIVNTVLEVSCRERVEDLIAALQMLVDRHEILRTAILWEQLPRPVQVVYREAVLPVEKIVLPGDVEPLEAIRELLRAGGPRHDLRRAPLIRLLVAPDVQQQRWFAILQIHHIVDDGASLAIMISEAVAYLEGRAERLAPPVPYREHVAQALARVHPAETERFFRSKFGHIGEPTAPFGLLDVRGDGTNLLESRSAIDSGLSARLRRQAQRLGVSAATMFHAAWALVLGHTSGRDEVVFGSVLLGRLQSRAGGKRVVGMFINTLPVRLQLSGSSAAELVLHTQRELVELLEHEQAPLALAQRCSGIEGSAPLFSAVLNYRHSVADPHANWGSARGLRVALHQYRTNYPITLSVDDVGEQFLLTTQTDARVAPERIGRYVSQAILSLVEALEQLDTTPAWALRVLPLDERQSILESFNPPAPLNRDTRRLHEIFEEQVRRTPDSVALIYESHALTYAELDARANQLAKCLAALGADSDALVGLCAERSVDLIVALLAVWKAGAAYLPLDPKLPVERLEFLLHDATPRIIVTQRLLEARFDPSLTRIVCLDGSWPAEASDELAPKRSVDPARANSLAYVIYTSGSTGQPKGVMVGHEEVTALWHGLEDVYRASAPFQRAALNASLNFDASVQQILHLLSGRTLVLVPEDLRRDAAKFVRFVEEARIEALDCTPSQLRAWMSVGLDEGRSAHLRVVLVGGEAIDAELWRRLARWRGTDFYNVYGPTECTVDVTVASIRGELDVPHIGRPMAQRRVYILDQSLEVVPVGVTGEICIGGAGVARGYLNRPELTAERFVRDPVAGKSPARMYRSGDLGRWRADGTIEYLGRNDQQVKIRGFRIELGEIEAHIRRHPQVQDAVVIAHEPPSGERSLVAYVAARSPAPGEQSVVAPEAATRELIDQWQLLHESTYQTAATGPSFVGWNSSYTGEPLPEADMHEWLSATLTRIRALRPTRVLEIGCGVGLLLQHLAPECERYVGTDFSAGAIGQLRKWCDAHPQLEHVELLVRAATELEGFSAGSYDLVILNSVVQYFPSANYLSEVIRGAARLLTPEGAIFVGDVRELASLSIFHTSVQLARAAATTSVGSIRRRIARAISQEKELVIDPRYFVQLAQTLPGIHTVDAQLKRGMAANELTRYRYDVVLSGARPTGANSVVTVAWTEGLTATEILRNLRDLGSPATLRVTGIPNARLSTELASLRLIEQSDDHREVGGLRREMRMAPVRGIDPEEFWREACKADCLVRVRPHAAGSYEIYLADTVAAQLPAGASQLDGAGEQDTPVQLANEPLENAFRQHLVEELREFLRKQLPDYMIPAAWVPLASLPQTPSGKVDRRALPPSGDRGETVGAFRAPRTALERALSQIWAQVLRVDQVGISDDFFALGGHSLLATQVAVRIESELSIDLPIRLLFECPTIEQLAPEVERLREASLMEDITKGDEGIRQLIEEVAAMPEAQASELLRRMSKDGRS